MASGRGSKEVRLPEGETSPIADGGTSIAALSIGVFT
jgi:hypothetical protein